MISLCGGFWWPEGSPDLDTCDYFLWGHLNAEVYKYRPADIEQLNNAILQKVTEIQPEMIL